jgi:hypothetical protein
MEFVNIATQTTGNGKVIAVSVTQGSKQNNI